MKVETDLKSGVSLAAPMAQVSNAATQVASFFNQANNQASAVTNYLGDQFSTAWNTLFG